MDSDQSTNNGENGEVFSGESHVNRLQPRALPQPPVFVSTLHIPPLACPQTATRYPSPPEPRPAVTQTSTQQAPQATSQSGHVAQASSFRAASNQTPRSVNNPIVPIAPSPWRHAYNQRDVNHNIIRLRNEVYARHIFMAGEDSDRLEAALDLSDAYPNLQRTTSKGLTEAQIEQLTTSLYDSGCPAGQVCVVCMYEFAGQELLRILPCKHMYHAECVDQWFQTKGNCPLCRYDLTKMFEKNY
ncbi:uncharacterized protein LOC143190573 [Rhynchophorus ferrugineus]|uniref:uncharacterized protein LOC143190573 n=1 Tax=Rhynchophorus ferrugineus TaxID=354439 RepID=UPI003FCDC1F4